MKRLLPLLLALTLCLAGCQLRNRQDSSLFIPTGESQTAQTEPTAAPVQDGADLALPAQGGGIIKEIYTASGVWPKDHPELDYLYRIPFIDLQGAYVDGCNQEIDRRYRAAAREAMDAMDRYETPHSVTIDYTVGLFGTVVSLEIDQTFSDGQTAFGVYNFDAKTGDAVERDRLVSCVGLDPQTLPELLSQAVETEFLRRYAGQQTLTPVAYADALEKTRSFDPDAIAVYLRPDGSLGALVPIWDLSGGQSLTPVVLAAETP